MSRLEVVSTTNLIEWIDTIPFSRPWKHLARDFSDGTLTAELIKCFFPKMIETRNYHRTSNVEQKKINWRLLSQRVLKKLDFPLSSDTITQLANSKREATEYFLNSLRRRIDSHMKHEADRKKKKQEQREESKNRSENGRNVQLKDLPSSISSSLDSPPSSTIEDPPKTK